MLRIALIRHAKSSWAHAGLSDHDRPLNERGRRAAPLIGRWLRDRALIADHALVSTAVRTRETWAMLPAETRSRSATFMRELYEAEAEAILQAIQKAPPAGLLAVVGHNPGMAETARRLLRPGEQETDFGKFPTCATALIALDTESWSDVRWRSGRLEAYVTPEELAAN